MPSKKLQNRHSVLRRIFTAVITPPLVAATVMSGNVIAVAQEELYDDQPNLETVVTAPEASDAPAETAPAEAPVAEELAGETPVPENAELAENMLMQPMAAVRAAGSGLKCGDGKFYAIHAWGEVLEFTNNGTSWSDTPTIKNPYFNFRDYNNSNVHWNGLGIVKGGNTAYAYKRLGYGNDGLYGSVIIGTATTNGTSTSQQYSLPIRSGLIAGAAAPDGTYYFGGYLSENHNVGWKKTAEQIYTNNPPIRTGAQRHYDSNSRSYYYIGTDGRYYYVGPSGAADRYYYNYADGRYYNYWSPEVYQRTGSTKVFALFSYTPTGGVKLVGKIPIPDSTATGDVNGDIAFDPSGNLYVLYHPSGAAKFKIVPVLKDSIANPQKGLITAQNSRVLELSGTYAGSGTQINGIAFMTDGSLMVERATENTSTSSASFLRLDPTTGEVLASATYSLYGDDQDVRFENGGYAGWLFGGQTDLASCAEFSTLKLQKELPKGRAAAGDQFQLEILDNSTRNSTRLAWESTTGNKSGVQAEVAGPVVAEKGETYRVRELPDADRGVGLEKTKFNYYKTELKCTDDTTGQTLSPSYVKEVNSTSTSERSWDVTVPSGSAMQITCTFTNTPDKGDLRWTKVGKPANADGSADAISLGGSVWSLLDENRNVVQGFGGISYENFGDCEPTDEHCDTSKVDADNQTGKFLITALPYGTYFLREDVAPKGYEKLAEPIKFSFGPGGIRFDDKDTLKRFDTFTNTMDLGRILNEKIKGSVNWVKIDGADNAVLGGSEWKLTKGTETIIVKDNTGQDDYNGRDTNKLEGDFTVKDLDFGEWTVTETKTPSGYRIESGKTYKFEVTEQKPEAEIGTKGAVPNYKARLEWTKVGADDKSKKLAGSEWELKFVPADGSGAQAKTISVKDCESGDCADVEDKNSTAGEFSVPELGDGTYTLTEKTAPAGYQLSKTVYTIVVNQNGYTVKKGNETGTRQKFPEADKSEKVIRLNVGDIENTPTQVTWKKVDDAGTALAGSQWSIVPEDAADDAATVIKVEDKYGSVAGVNDANDAAGQFTVQKLKYGTYTLKETKAPAGYVISAEAAKGYEFTISAENPTFDFIEAIKNEKQKGALTWTKVQKGHENVLLSGSEWRVVRATGDGGERPTGVTQADDIEVIDCVADSADKCTGPDKDPAEGKFRIEGLELGWYYVVEDKAPVGYKLDTTRHYVQITSEQLNSAGVVVAGSFENELGKGVKLPLTGGRGADLYFILSGLLGVLAAVMGGVHVMRRRNS